LCALFKLEHGCNRLLHLSNIITAVINSSVIQQQAVIKNSVKTAKRLSGKIHWWQQRAAINNSLMITAACHQQFI